ncbi:hypothetical protein AVEN_137675-1 [Araneus ventricosus]|uniref:Uncharacterized protein n=1 Tax=Araneus ventricosus TaxID=182803 RepID=A0A4Y2J8W4_ARAVE|nr:hypothetical protein AVEN_137675-1 [Araneus ventricosus]
MTHSACQIVCVGWLHDVFTSLSEENLVPDKCLEPVLVAVSGLYGWADFPLALLQEFLSFASSMDNAMQKDHTMTQHARAFALDGFTMFSHHSVKRILFQISVWNPYWLLNLVCMGGGLQTSHLNF